MSGVIDEFQSDHKNPSATEPLRPSVRLLEPESRRWDDSIAPVGRGFSSKPWGIKPGFCMLNWREKYKVYYLWQRLIAVFLAIP